MLTFKKPTNQPTPKQKTQNQQNTPTKTNKQTPPLKNHSETEKNKSSQGNIKQFLKKSYDINQFKKSLH